MMCFFWFIITTVLFTSTHLPRILLISLYPPMFLQLWINSVFFCLHLILTPLSLSLPPQATEPPSSPIFMRTLDLSHNFTVAQYCVIHHSAYSYRRLQPQWTGNKIYKWRWRSVCGLGEAGEAVREAVRQKWKVECGRWRKTFRKSQRFGDLLIIPPELKSRREPR